MTLTEEILLKIYKNGKSYRNKALLTTSMYDVSPDYLNNPIIGTTIEECIRKGYIKEDPRLLFLDLTSDGEKQIIKYI